MRRAVYVPPFGTFGDARLLADLAAEAEASGWDGFFLWDHILFEEDVPFADAWLALAAMATATERIRLGPLVTPLPRRRPWKVAREAVTLDRLSGGRAVLGVGLGIDFWREYGAFGGEPANDTVRAGLLDEGIEVITRLWSGDPVHFQGRHLSVDGARFLPPPVQQPRIPIWSAALWPLRPDRPGPVRRAARVDGVVPFGPAGPLTPDDVRVLRAAIDAERTSPDPYDVCLYGPAAAAGAYAAAGVTWLLESLLPGEPLDEVRRVIAAGPAPSGR